jgi:hypothetical protein
MNVSAANYAGNTFIQATNATGTSKCFRSNHRHNEGFNINTGAMVNSGGTAAVPNHNHDTGTFNRDNSESHTHTVLAAAASGNVSATAINVPYLSLNYIMKL